MSDAHKVFGDTDSDQQKAYQREARLQYDQDVVRESQDNWGSYTASQQEFIKEQGNEIYQELMEALKAGHAADSAEVKAILVRWHEHLRYFYEPSLDLLRGLGQLYNSDPRFVANFQKLHVDLPAFLEQAIEDYVDELETAAIQALLDADEGNDTDVDERVNRLIK
ncbi:MAG: TipAS antibiotic-recognition domain-containing protein [Chloroflexota bacterium]